MEVDPDRSPTPTLCAIRPENGPNRVDGHRMVVPEGELLGPEELKRLFTPLQFADYIDSWKQRGIEREEFGDCHCPKNGSCDEDCVTRGCLHECDSAHCRRENCSNRRIQCRMKLIERSLFTQQAPLRVFRTELKGFGLVSTERLPKGSVVSAYIGAIISRDEGDDLDTPRNYIMQAKPGFCVDSSTMGTLTRFVNHSCEPNCCIQVWTVCGYPVPTLFTMEDIAPYVELSIDYAWEFPPSVHNRPRCFCGAPNCRRFIQAKSADLLVLYTGYDTLRKRYKKPQNQKAAQQYGVFLVRAWERAAKRRYEIAYSQLTPFRRGPKMGRVDDLALRLADIVLPPSYERWKAKAEVVVNRARKRQREPVMTAGSQEDLLLSATSLIRKEKSKRKGQAHRREDATATTTARIASMQPRSTRPEEPSKQEQANLLRLRAQRFALQNQRYQKAADPPATPQSANGERSSVAKFKVPRECLLTFARRYVLFIEKRRTEERRKAEQIETDRVHKEKQERHEKIQKDKLEMQLNLLAYTDKYIQPDEVTPVPAEQEPGHHEAHRLLPPKPDDNKAPERTKAERAAAFRLAVQQERAEEAERAKREKQHAREPSGSATQTEGRHIRTNTASEAAAKKEETEPDKHAMRTGSRKKPSRTRCRSPSRSRSKSRSRSRRSRSQSRSRGRNRKYRRRSSGSSGTSVPSKSRNRVRDRRG
eukprot:TRINITY_DN3189_c0_g1_i1.p1 TRINITY_DN3189_c0_g1~~TRINITY_DN3189_c0_g1_i1.p1  ORF type:complete len:711 (-),score=66.20 TRINITY_DN3189_c0_g1_i1:4-2115(-)